MKQEIEYKLPAEPSLFPLNLAEISVKTYYFLEYKKSDKNLQRNESLTYSKANEISRVIERDCGVYVNPMDWVCVSVFSDGELHFFSKSKEMFPIHKTFYNRIKEDLQLESKLDQKQIKLYKLTMTRLIAKIDLMANKTEREINLTTYRADEQTFFFSLNCVYKKFILKISFWGNHLKFFAMDRYGMRVFDHLVFMSNLTEEKLQEEVDFLKEYFFDKADYADKLWQTIEARKEA